MDSARAQIAKNQTTKELVATVATLIEAGNFAKAYVIARDGISRNRELFKVQPMSNNETPEILRDLNARLERRTREVTGAAAKKACLELRDYPEKEALRRDIIDTFELSKRK